MNKAFNPTLLKQNGLTTKKLRIDPIDLQRRKFDLETKCEIYLITKWANHINRGSVGSTSLRSNRSHRFFFKFDP